MYNVSLTHFQYKKIKLFFFKHCIYRAYTRLKKRNLFFYFYFFGFVKLDLC